MRCAIDINARGSELTLEISVLIARRRETMLLVEVRCVYNALVYHQVHQQIMVVFKVSGG